MPTVPYVVTTFDLCVSGFERLRSQDEILLCAYPSDDSTPSDLCDEWLREIDSTDRGDDFDYEAAECIVRAWCKVNGQSVAHDLRQVDFGQPDDGGELVVAFLYLRVGA